MNYVVQYADGSFASSKAGRSTKDLNSARTFRNAANAKASRAFTFYTVGVKDPKIVEVVLSLKNAQPRE